MSVGQRTITVSHYKDMTQETLADGVKIVVDGHVITATPDAITIDGKTQTFDPTQDVEITVDENGAVQAKTLSADAPRPDEETCRQRVPARRRHRNRTARRRLRAVARVIAPSSDDQASFASRGKRVSSDCSSVHTQALLEGVVVARLDAGFALADAEQLEDGLERLEAIERDHGELHRRHEFAPLRAATGT